MIGGHEDIAIAIGEQDGHARVAQAPRERAAAAWRCPTRWRAAASSRHPRPASCPWRRSRAAAQAGSSRSIRSGSMRRRATLVRGSRRMSMPATIAVRSRSGWRVAKVSTVIAPIENPAAWNVSRPSASANAREVVDQQVARCQPSSTSQRVPPWPRASTQVELERLPEERPLRRPILSRGGRRAVQHARAAVRRPRRCSGRRGRWRGRGALTRV